ncbi:formimidoylglutamase [Fluviicola taffensis]|uniref:Arginase/agmatinase/formiminoglutamase n=1 Tax=Fluviicola taffensis (strain DSM 16823 / NCIMB 13979 / RW262) TaxID=755732 RepID=F2IJE6_FLUTR|nr:formimidoylglutamase [Fluviicola taffensis]AEA46043.1 Arginase/agmatinase/formiminoglutamase [Fluviicola taffensis DSM 16823]
MLESTYFKVQFPEDLHLKQWLTERDGEIRIGQNVLFRSVAGLEGWKEKRFHIIGIKEDIGPRLNAGKGGSDLAFDAFITRFLAVQSNQFLSGNSICIHGYICLKESITAISNMHVDDLDYLVSIWVQEVVEAGGIPIVIGGGHNNAYPIIKGVSEAMCQPISVVNLDPHADTRAMEGRHSGNPFSYAFEDGFLQNYSVLGLHESYNNQFILDRLQEMNAFFTFYESWLEKSFKFQADIDKVYDTHFQDLMGVELDMDAIAYMPSSAFSPSGISVDQARIYIRKMASLEKVCYLHLPEAAPKNEMEELVVGKALTYLVTDFLKEYLKHHH